MKIAFVIYDRPNYTGGPIINALRLLPELVRRNHEVLAIIGYKNSAPHAELLKEGGVEVQLFKQAYTEINVNDILKISIQFNPDVFVSNISAQAGYASYWLKKSGIPTIIAHRSDDKRNWCTAKVFGIKNWKWQHSAIVCVSDYLKEESLKIKENELNIKVIPSGVPVPTNKSTHVNSKLKVVYSGRLEQTQKRIWDLIEAFAVILENNLNIEFTIIGEGQEKEKLQKFIKDKKLTKSITLRNNLVAEHYHDELIKHDVIVLLSDYEGMPGSIMDGMACGLVPVCYKFNGIEELVVHNKTGLIVEDRKMSFYQALKELENDSNLLAELSINARNHIIDNFSLSIAANRWEELFNSLLKESGQKSSISVPLFLNLPNPPSCYQSLGEDIRKEIVGGSKLKAKRILKRIFNKKG